MRIKKIYLKNFKGIKDKKIIDFESKTSLLTGPNGFGKTTIFDAIELCLTDEIHRTITNEAVTHHRRDYKKIFFQNDENEDVIIKVWLEKKTDSVIEDLIITKYLSHDKEERYYKQGRKHKPDDFYIFQTYTDTPDTFTAEDFNPAEKKRITNSEINEFFGFNSSEMKIKDIYKLFNYLQQEETTFFLKQSESNRKNSLSFLFNTNTEENELKRISDAIKKLRQISTILEDKINANKKVREVNAVQYKPLFPSQEVQFDQEVLFDNKDIDIAHEEYQQYIGEIHKLISFRRQFSPEEYSKKQSVDFLDSQIKKQDFINYYVLHKLIMTDRYKLLSEEYELKEDKMRLKAFILQNHLGSYRDYQVINKKYDQYEAFLRIEKLEDKIEKCVLYVENMIPETKQDYIELVNHRKELKSTVSDIESLITEIIQLRNSLKSKLEQYKEDENYDASCPYCGFIWETYEVMNTEFNKKEERFRKSLDEQSKKLVEIEEKLIKEYINPIREKMFKFKEGNKKTDEKLVNLIGRLQEKEFDFTILSRYSLDKIIWKELGDYEKLGEDLKQLEEYIEKNMIVSSELFKKIRSLSIKSHDEDIRIIKEIVSEEELDKLTFDDLKKQKSLQDLKEQADKLKSLLEEQKKNYVFEENRVEDELNLYSKYFQSKKENFESTKTADFERKIEYIDYVFSLNQSEILGVYLKRNSKLKNIIKNMERTRDCIDKIIKRYKKDMANNIKVPFYIYSAKILQNYQQGMGVFLSTSDKNDAIRFLTDTSSDHDAIHHLSSGQLAVTSIAFTLAINKTYNISNNLKFLAIDDPIQEMDSMNIYSFIELIRHEFLNDYQLIFSTHNDLNALYMKYKFEKMGSDKVSLFNVQSEFFY